MKSIILIAAYLAVLTDIVAGASLTNYKAVDHTDNYESGIVAKPVDKTAGGYVAYNGWGYTLFISPKAPSGTKTIATGIRNQVLEGQPAFLPLNDKVKCFDMKSIRNGCFANTQAPGVAVPVSCTVQFSARSHITRKTTTKLAIYNPPVGSLTEPFNTTTFDRSFKCVDRVDITLISATIPGGGATVGVALDDFSYLAYVLQ